MRIHLLVSSAIALSLLSLGGCSKCSTTVTAQATASATCAPSQITSAGNGSAGNGSAGNGSAGSGSASSTMQGSVSVRWTITQNGQPSNCVAVGAASVAAVLQNQATGNSRRFAFVCPDAMGTAGPVPTGTYDVTLTLLAIDGSAIAVSTRQTAVITANKITQLTPVMFSVVGAGSASKLALSVAAVSAVANCTPSAGGGAGITGNTLLLVHASGGCAPVTFTRTRGGTTLGTYTVNCSSPPVAACIERDEVLTTNDLDAGAYMVSVTGLVNAAKCWAATVPLSIAATANVPTTTTIQLAHLAVPGC